MIFAIPHLALAFYCDFSGTSLFDEWYITFYNMIFTTLTIIYLGAADQDIRFRSYLTKKEIEEKKKFDDPIINELGELKSTDDESVLAYLPTKVIRNIKDNMQNYYYISQRKLYFNYLVFFYHSAAGFIQGLFITIFNLVYFQNVQVDSSGHTTDFWFVSFVIYTSLVVGVNSLVLIRANHITMLLFWLVILSSLLPYIIFMYVYDHFTLVNSQSSFSARYAMGTWQFYACVGMNVIVLTFGEIIKLFGKYYVRPTMVEYTKQLRRKRRLDQPFYFDKKIVDLVKRGHVIRLKKKKIYDTDEEQDKNMRFLEAIVRGED